MFKKGDASCPRNAHMTGQGTLKFLILFSCSELKNKNFVTN